MRKVILQMVILLSVLVSLLSITSSAQALPNGCPSDMNHYWKLNESSQPYADSYGID